MMTSIHVLGLAVGICAALVIFLLVQYEYSFDKWEPNAAHTYQVITDTRPGQQRAAVPIPAPKAIKASIPAVEALTYFIEDPFFGPHITTRTSSPNENSGSTHVYNNVEGIIFADQNYFNFIPHEWIAGQASSLNTLNKVVLTSSMAAKLFPGIPTVNTIGKLITLQDSLPFEVSGIVNDLNERTDFKATIFLSMPTLMQTPLSNNVLMSPAWYNLNGNFKCFVQLQPNASLNNVNQQLAELFKAHPFNSGDIKHYSAHLQPLSDIHFNMELGGKVSKSTLLNLGLLATILILLAVINYVNLATAMGATRAKEIGIRKTFGGSKNQLFIQFLTETTLLAFLSTLLAILILPFTFDAFKSFLPKGLQLSSIFSPMFIIFIVMLMAFVAIVSGFYPAHVLTKYRPALILKDQQAGQSHKKATLRQILTVFQFVIAQVFLILVVLMGKQLHFVTHHDMGFQKEAIIYFAIPDLNQTKRSEKETYLQKLKNINGIQQISLASGPPIRDAYMETTISWMKNDKKESFYHTQFRTIDSNYLSLYNLQLMAGRNIHYDSSNVLPGAIINESMMQHMGYTNPKDIIGEKLLGFYDQGAVITGVVKNFNTQSLHYSFQPTILFADNFNNNNIISIKLLGNNPQVWAKTLTKINSQSQSFFPNATIQPEFLDQSIDQLYEMDSRLSKLMNWATGLTIFISLLGLLGLVSFVANRRTKEIGIRKVLGASTFQIIILLSKGLIKLVLIASIIAAPIAWYFSHKWLQGFAFKTRINWWIFGISVLGILIIALAVLWVKAIKTARKNPAASLKTE